LIETVNLLASLLLNAIEVVFKCIDRRKRSIEDQERTEIGGSGIH